MVVSDFCTAYQMTKVLAATTGQAGIPCNPASNAPPVDRPDEPEPAAVDGDDDLALEDPEPGAGADPEKVKRDLTPEEEESHWVWIKGGPK